MHISIPRRWFLAFLCIVWLAAIPLFAKDRSAEQKGVLDSVNTYLAASLQGNVKKIRKRRRPPSQPRRNFSRRRGSRSVRFGTLDGNDGETWQKVGLLVLERDRIIIPSVGCKGFEDLRHAPEQAFEQEVPRGENRPDQPVG